MMTIARKSKQSTEHGFALLVTITLVAFLVMIVVALASLTRVETKVASNSQVLSQARQNALFSLNLALGRLQEYAGPDDRLTARSDITSAGPAYQPYLTGVWSRTNSTNVPDAWLVSGDPANAKDTADVLDPATASAVYADGDTPMVLLVGDSTVDTPASRVLMATRSIDIPAGSLPGQEAAASVGRYAWWIGDEGIKASASMVDPLLLSGAISYDSGGTTGDDWSDAVKRARLDQLQPVRPRLERLFAGMTPGEAATASLLDKVVELTQLDLVNGSSGAAARKGAFHSVTPLAEAVLLDHYGTDGNYSPTAISGLRRDLSDLACPLYSDSGGVRAAVKAYQEFRASIPDEDKPYDAVYQPARSLPALPVDGANTPNYYFPVFHAGPVVTEFGLRFYFTVDPGSGEIILNYIVEAELWNPYAARLEMEKTGSGTVDKPLAIYIDMNLKVSLTDDKGVKQDDIDIMRPIIDANGRADATDNDTAYGVLVDVNEAWEPGAVRVVSGATRLTDGGYGGSLGLGKYVSSGATKIESVDLPAVTQFPLYLTLNPGFGTAPQGIQRYYASMTFGAHSGVVNQENDYVCGYGFNLSNSYFRWLQESGSGLDVRRPYLRPDASSSPIYATGPTQRWDSDPANNATQSPDGAFVNQVNLALYDLPRQELVSIGDLRQMSGQKNADLGSSHAGAVNLWYDRYFFSTVPRVHEWNFAGGEPLPNRYLRYIPSGRAEATLDKLRAYDKSARFLLQRGSFNINSTSVDAWRMMLGQRLEGWRGNSTSESGDDLDNVFFRLSHGAQQLANEPIAAGDTPSSAEAVNTGGRRLTDDEIGKMARAIVKVIRERGYPYPALAKMLSRMNETTSRPFYLACNWVNSTAFPSSYAQISCPPGLAVSPADIAAALAPVMTTRSDTFLIRAYGDSRNPVSGTVEGRSWCEAVLQRVPDVTDPVTGSYSDGDEVQISTSKYPFGRKFKIVSFRWLNSENI